MTRKPFLHTPAEVTVNGETFQILPFPWGKQHIVAAKLLPAFTALNPTEGSVLSFSDLIEAGGEGLMEVVAMAIGKTREFMDTIYDYDEGKELTMAVIEANKEQFVKKLLPDLMKMLASKTTTPAKA